MKIALTKPNRIRSTFIAFAIFINALPIYNTHKYCCHDLKSLLSPHGAILDPRLLFKLKATAPIN
jgi:hypothetical protein